MTGRLTMLLAVLAIGCSDADADSFYPASGYASSDIPYEPQCHGYPSGDYTIDYFEKTGPCGPQDSDVATMPGGPAPTWLELNPGALECDRTVWADPNTVLITVAFRCEEGKSWYQAILHRVVPVSPPDPTMVTQ